MSQINTFRHTFCVPCRQRINWFPGHMNKGMRQMQQKLLNIDVIIEMHDARVPISGRNFQYFDTMTGNGVKPHILVLNKVDLLGGLKEQRKVEKQILSQQPRLKNVIFTNCKDQRSIGIVDLLPLATKLVGENSRFNRTRNTEFNLMIVGVPNVGKSSIINVLRNLHLKKSNAALVGAKPGVTRAIGERIKIQEHPAIYMIDTPGILQPSIADDEMGMKLALIGCIPDHIVGEELIADYLLYWLNKNRRYEYVDLLNLKCGPSDKISVVLAEYAQHQGFFHRVKQSNGQVELMTNLLAAAQKFIQLFRSGKLGGINLDN